MNQLELGKLKNGDLLLEEVETPGVIPTTMISNGQKEEEVAEVDSEDEATGEEIVMKMVVDSEEEVAFEEEIVKMVEEASEVAEASEEEIVKMVEASEEEIVKMAEV